jgi:two-component system, NarL family, response regulator DesR
MIRIVIADDHAGIRLAFMRLIGKESDMMVVGEAENGALALEQVEKSQPDILLLDIEMPILSGIDVARTLENKKDCPKIIMVSNYSDQEFVDDLLGLGIRGFIVKEDAPESLVQAICEVYGGAKKWLSPQLRTATS